MTQKELFASITIEGVEFKTKVIVPEGQEDSVKHLLLNRLAQKILEHFINSIKFF